MKLLIFSLLVFVFCNNTNKIRCLSNTSAFTDYRDAYVGSYSCKTKCTKPGMNNAPKTTYTTETLTVSKDTQDSVLVISNGSIVAKCKLINKNLNPYPNYNKWRGRFYASDSVYFCITLGMVSYYGFEGKKI
jgi:hypothetical protein